MEGLGVWARGRGGEVLKGFGEAAEDEEPSGVFGGEVGADGAADSVHDVFGGGDDAQALGGVEIHARELVGLERGDRDVGDGREVVEDVSHLRLPRVILSGIQCL